jgi:ligand-binding sensor domain-containing protein/DNA-binding response OmpR family regulator/two-component sensor histidine kinase
MDNMGRFTGYLRSLLLVSMMFISLMLCANNGTFYDSGKLSSNAITSIIQDKQGYIWIGTEYGLNKFDGVHITQYYSDDTDANALSDDIVRCMLSDSTGTLWVVTDRGVQRYNRSTDAFDSVSFGDNSFSINANDIAETPTGEIWVLSSTGLFKIDKEKLTSTRVDKYSKLMRPNCNNMCFDHNGRIWVAYDGPELQMIDTKTGKSKLYTFPNNRVVDIMEDGAGRLIAATYSEILQFDNSSQKFATVASFTRMASHKLYNDRNKRLLLMTSGSGIWEVNVNGKYCKHLQLDTDIEKITQGNGKIHAFLRDRAGNEWVGYFQRGLLFISNQENLFNSLPLSRLANNNNNILRSVFSNSAGNFFLCQELGGVTEVNNSGQPVGHWMDGYTVNTMYENADGSFWVGTYRDGLYKLDTRTGAKEWMPASGQVRVSSITKDKKGNIYIGVFSEGLRSLTPDGKTERKLAKGNLKLINPYLNILFTDRDGLIWIGHYYGIDIYNPQTDKLINLKLPDALRPAIVYDIKQASDGAILIGSNKGLFKYDKKNKGDEWARLTTKDGLPNNIVCSITIANDSVLWISTYHGLARVKQNGDIDNFFKGNGLEDWSYLRGVSTYTKSGNIVLGNQNGITYFNPEKITHIASNQQVMLTGMRIGDLDVNTTTLSNGKHVIVKPLDESEVIAVSFEDNTFSLRFSTMDFHDSSNIHYEYRFEDEPKGKWHQMPSGTSEIFFTHLEVGLHKLQVRAYDNGVYSEVKSFKLHITPPWYRTAGAYIIYIILLIGLANLLWYNYWNRKKAEVNEDKIKFFVDISHELRSPLTLIKSPLEKLLRNSHDPQTVRALRNMERNTNRLLTLVNQILSIRKIETGHMTFHYAETQMGEFINNICHDFDYQVENKNIKLRFENEAGDATAWIDCDNFDKVVTNLITNAIKYVQKDGEINVLLRKPDSEHIELVVTDNGPGIDEAQLRRIFERFYQASARPAAGQMSYGIGLNLTQKIVALHGGTIVARNRKDVTGSEFVVTLKLGSSHLPQEQLTTSDYFAAHVVEEVKPQLTTDGDKPRRARKKTTYHVAVVDDDEEIRTFLQTELGEIYHVQLYSDGQKALEGIIDTVPDLVVSDIVMPKMDGFELLKRLKNNTKTSHIPVILLTTNTGHESRIEGLDQGADAYIDKPFNMEELEVRIAGLIANRIRVKGKFSGVQEQEGTVRQIELKGNDAALMEKIMKVINARIDDSNFNVEALAEEVGLSRVQLHRRVKELTGITVGEFIRNLRLQQAAKLLAAGDTTVAQVTYAVGIANPTHFSSAFKKHFGVTPSEYIAKNKKQ